MALAAMVAGRRCGSRWPAALRQWRGVNETISSLLLTYIAIALMNHFVEGPLRDPSSLNKPSTWPIGDANMIGTIPGIDVHWGLVFGMVACLLAWLFQRFTTCGFAMQVIGGNPKTARMMGLDVGRYVLLACAAGGAAAGLAGMVEVAAVHGKANASLAVGYGYTGILVAFLARHNPLAIVPVAILLGGIGAIGRPAAAPARPARRRGGGAAGHPLRRHPGQRDAVRPAQWSRLSRRPRRPADGRQRASACGACRSPCWRAPSASARRSSSCSLGECLTERSGRINLGLEGTLVMGAMSAYGVALRDRLAVARRAGGGRRRRCCWARCTPASASCRGSTTSPPASA